MKTTAVYHPVAAEAPAPSTILARCLETAPTVSPVVLRAILAFAVFPHGAQKLLGWFGGYGFGGTMGYFTDTMGIPTVLAFGVIVLEFFGPLFLLAGIATRGVALGLAVVLSSAVLMVHIDNGFFMNWFGNQAGEGIEYFILAVGIAAALVVSGAGRWSVDAVLADRLAGADS